jgi:hypothetical protein
MKKRNMNGTTQQTLHNKHYTTNRRAGSDSRAKKMSTKPLKALNDSTEFIHSEN